MKILNVFANILLLTIAHLTLVFFKSSISDTTITTMQTLRKGNKGDLVLDTNVIKQAHYIVSKKGTFRNCLIRDGQVLPLNRLHRRTLKARRTRELLTELTASRGG